MSATVPPSPPPSLATTLATALSAARGTVVSVPDGAALTQGHSLNAQVVSSGSGQLVLSSSIGRLTVQSTAGLPNGTAVLVQVLSVGPTPQVSLHFHQNAGTSHGPLPGGVPNASGGTGAATPQSTPPVVTQLTEGSVLQASVTHVAGQVGTGQGIAAGQGTAGQATAASTASPAAQAAASASGPPAASTATPGAPATAAAFTAGTNLTVRVLAAAPPGSDLPAVPALAAQSGARVFAASVTGQQTGGGPILTSQAADLALANAHPLPTGSRVLLEVINLRPPVAGDGSIPLSFLGGRWEALSEAMAALQHADPALMRQAMETAIPTPSPRIAGTMLFFLSAMFSGDVRRFFSPDTMRQLNRAGVGERLSSEFGQLQRTATDSTGQDWRLFLIPILTEEGLEQLRFMLRKNEEDGKAAESESGTRFMIEVNMSRLGPFQFDGLTRNKHLDLVVRTQQELPTEIRDEIRSIFGNTITALGFTGTIALRTVSRFEISPVEQTAECHKDLMV